MEDIQIDFYSCITSHVYFKVFFVLVFGIILTFADDIVILKQKVSLYVVLLILLMIILTNMDDYGYGIILLIMLLFVLTYNIQVHERINKTNRML
jgi:hypothetical protein